MRKATTKLGRPALPEIDRRQRTTIRISPAEREVFQREADRIGVPLQTWMRMACRHYAGLTETSVKTGG
jgi:predicted DNA binding CopG/RHH family protein